MRCPACQADNDESSAVCFECGASLGAIVKGSLIAGRYEVLKALGRGGMGMVYLAHDRHLDEQVALKVLRSELLDSPDLAKRFRSEIKLARRVSHRNVCKIFEYGEEAGRQYIAMAYVDGVELKKLLREQGPFPTEEAFEIAIRVSEALEAVHEEGIVHRDLKTPNIMKDKKGVVRLMDFGIAKDAAGGTAVDLTGTGMIIGSPEYMSPEQWHGHRADARSDIYALGIVVYELFTGRVPFHADTVPSLMHLHLSEPPPLEGEPARLLPEPVRPVLARALAKDPPERFQTAAEMAAALRQARTAFAPWAGAPVPARTVTPTYASPLTRQDVVPMTEPMRTAVPTAVLTVSGHAATSRSQPAAPATPSGVRAERPAASPPRPAATRPQPAASAGGRGSLLGGIAAAAVLVGGLVFWLTRSQPSTEGPAAAPAPAAAAAPPTAPPTTIVAIPTPAPSVAVATPPPAPAPERGPAATAIPLPRPTPPPPTRAAQMGTLRVIAVPPANVTVDGKPVTGSLRKIQLPAGMHVVRLEHSDYQPIQRAVKIQAGQMMSLEIDFAEDGTKRR